MSQSPRGASRGARQGAPPRKGQTPPPPSPPSSGLESLHTLSLKLLDPGAHPSTLAPTPQASRSPSVAAWVGVAMLSRSRGLLDAEAAKVRLQQLEAGRTDVGGRWGSPGVGGACSQWGPGSPPPCRPPPPPPTAGVPAPFPRVGAPPAGAEGAPRLSRRGPQIKEAPSGGKSTFYWKSGRRAESVGCGWGGGRRGGWKRAGGGRKAPGAGESCGASRVRGDADLKPPLAIRPPGTAPLHPSSLFFPPRPGLSCSTWLSSRRQVSLPPAGGQPCGGRREFGVMRGVPGFRVRPRESRAGALGPEPPQAPGTHGGWSCGKFPPLHQVPRFWEGRSRGNSG